MLFSPMLLFSLSPVLFELCWFIKLCKLVLYRDSNFVIYCIYLLIFLLFSCLMVQQLLKWVRNGREQSWKGGWSWSACTHPPLNQAFPPPVSSNTTDRTQLTPPAPLPPFFYATQTKIKPAWLSLWFWHQTPTPTCWSSHLHLPHLEWLHPPLFIGSQYTPEWPSLLTW